MEKLIGENSWFSDPEDESEMEEDPWGEAEMREAPYQEPVKSLAQNVLASKIKCKKHGESIPCWRCSAEKFNR